MELYIKYVINDLSKAKETGHRLKSGHSLGRNWVAVKSLLKRIETTEDDVAYFEKVVTCIDEVDQSNGQTFRYPENIKGNRHLEEWSTINLPTVQKHNEKIAAIAHTWHGRIESALETSRIAAADNA